MKTGWGIKSRLEMLDEFFYGQVYIDVREERRAPDGTFNRTDVVEEVYVRLGAPLDVSGGSPADLDADEAERAERAGA